MQVNDDQGIKDLICKCQTYKSVNLEINKKKKVASMKKNITVKKTKEHYQEVSV